MTDELWERVKEYIPQRKRDGKKTYRRKAGAGWKPMPPRQVLEGGLLRAEDRHPVEGAS
jgi:hypothetical protein